MAHITVVFHETPQMEDSDSHPGGSGVVSGPSPSIQLGIGLVP